MAAADASPVPFKGVAYRVTFPIFDAAGGLVSGATSPVSRVSKDGGTFATTTAAIVEIATASGMYYLDLTAAEMNADTVAVTVASGTGKTTPIVLYPEPKLQVDGVVGAASSTTSIVTSSLDPAATVTDQFKGRIVIFAKDTTTANLRGQIAEITAMTAGGVLTVSQLSTAPVSGDIFTIV